MMRKHLAAITAVICMISGMPMASQPVSALYTTDCLVLSIACDEETGEAESYLMTNEYGSSLYTVTAEEMELYLTEDSAVPAVGDIVSVYAELGRGSASQGIPGYFLYGEDSSFTVLGTVEEYYPVQRDLAVIRKTSDSDLYLLQDTETGDRFIYFPKNYCGYETPYNMGGAELGDIVSFYMRTSDDYEYLYVPYAVTEGDGTVPELSDAEMKEDYWTAPAVVIGASYSYGNAEPSSYLLSMSGGEAELTSYQLFEHMDVLEAPSPGDVLMIDCSAYLESYPLQLVIPQNGRITNIGSAADVYGTVTVEVTENTGTKLVLADVEDNTKSYSYNILNVSWKLFHSDAADAQPGDVLTFMLDQNGDPVMAMTDEVLATPVREFVVVAVDHETNPQNYIIMGINSESTYTRGITYHLNADVVADCLAEGERMPQFGDVLELTGHMLTYSDAFLHSNDFTLQQSSENLGTLINDGVIRNLGSVFDNYEEVEMTYTEEDEFDYYYCNISYTDSGNILYPCDYIGTYAQPGCTDLRTLAYGDTVTMIAYNGNPVFPAITNPSLGDVNCDTRIDVLDAAYLLQVSAAEGAQGEKTLSVNTAAMDVNGDGASDATDAALILEYAAYAGSGGTLGIAAYLQQK